MNKSSQSFSDHDRDRRRLIERLSGWRLIAFFTVLALNLLGLAFMSFLVLVPNPQWQAAFIGLASSQSALFAIAIGSFRFRVVAKFMILVVHLVACLWAIRQFTAMGFNNPVIIAAFFSIGTQSFLICGAASLAGTKLSVFKSIPRRLEFRIRDLLIVTTVFGVSMPTLQFLLPNWTGIWNSNPQHVILSCGKGLVHASWCVMLLSLFVKGIFPIRMINRSWISRLCQTAFLLVLVLFQEVGLKLLNVEPFATWDRIAFASWLSLSFIPVAGLESESIRPKWVTMTEFYTRIQGQCSRISRGPNTTDSTCITEPCFPEINLAAKPGTSRTNSSKPNSIYSSANSGSDSSKRAVAIGTRSNNPLVE